MSTASVSFYIKNLIKLRTTERFLCLDPFLQIFVPIILALSDMIYIMDTSGCFIKAFSYNAFVDRALTLSQSWAITSVTS